MVRPEAEKLVELGPLPDEEMATVEELKQCEALLHLIERLVTAEEAKALVGLFGPDGCYGLTWSLLHLIETAPGWLLWECLPQDSENEWIQRLRLRLENVRRYGME